MKVLPCCGVDVSSQGLVKFWRCSCRISKFFQWSVGRADSWGMSVSNSERVPEGTGGTSRRISTNFTLVQTNSNYDRKAGKTNEMRIRINDVCRRGCNFMWFIKLVANLLHNCPIQQVIWSQLWWEMCNFFSTTPRSAISDNQHFPSTDFFCVWKRWLALINCPSW